MIELVTKMVNQFVRMGEGDEYIEICMDWESGDYTKILWWLRDIVGENNYELLREAAKEIFGFDK